MKIIARTIYVKTIRGLRRILEPLGILAYLERRQGRMSRWLRSLFAIYDIDDLVHLDVAWWTFEAIEYADVFLKERPNARVFEWGSGASTIWLAKRAEEVVSVEHDQDWANQVSGRIQNSAHVQLNVVTPAASGNVPSGKFGFEGQFFDDYVAKIDDFDGMFDLIVIDGRAREACLQRAMARLSKNGIILLDDYKRKRYQIAAQSLGVHIRKLDGLAACLPLPDSTGIITKT